MDLTEGICFVVAMKSLCFIFSLLLILDLHIIYFGEVQRIGEVTVAQLIWINMRTTTIGAYNFSLETKPYLSRLILEEKFTR